MIGRVLRAFAAGLAAGAGFVVGVAVTRWAIAEPFEA